MSTSISKKSIRHDCGQELRTFGLRATPARKAILRLLEKAKAPLGVNTLIQHLGKQSLKIDPATVFRIMNHFSRKGIVTPVHLGENTTRYELANQHHHHHLICEGCGTIEDITECLLPQIEKNIRLQKHFLIKRHSLEFYGLCKQCL